MTISDFFAIVFSSVVVIGLLLAMIMIKVDKLLIAYEKVHRKELEDTQ